MATKQSEFNNQLAIVKKLADSTHYAADIATEALASLEIAQQELAAACESVAWRATQLQTGARKKAFIDDDCGLEASQRDVRRCMQAVYSAQNRISLLAQIEMSEMQAAEMRVA